mmetsp:Transcript_47430/g.100790  ORF Transcript_47430/g.100790 Transcript_47430/m.100790 type:complete len:104 (-) Transcript_47430:419-730(-)
MRHRDTLSCTRHPEKASTIAQKLQNLENEKALIAAEEECHLRHFHTRYASYHAAVNSSFGIYSLSSNIEKQRSARKKTRSKERAGKSSFESNPTRYWKSGIPN